jgi:methionyl-tRNA formyltransferase
LENTKSKIALVVSNNILFENECLTNLVKNNHENIGLIAELNFKNPKTNYIDYIIQHIILLRFKGSFFIFGIHFKNFIYRVFNSEKYIKTIRETSEGFNINYIKINDVNDDDFINYLLEKRIEVIINSGNQIYRKKILSKIKVLNRHSAILPSYGGLLPIFWQLLNGEKEGGVTLHWIDEKIDEGKIAYCERFPISNTNSMISLYKKAFEISLVLCDKAIKDISKNVYTESIMDLSGKSYYSWPSWKQIKLFNERKLKIV